MTDKDRSAVAWWLEVDGDDRYVCFDTNRGETVVFDVTNANFGGEIQS